MRACCCFGGMIAGTVLASMQLDACCLWALHVGACCQSAALALSCLFMWISNKGALGHTS